MELHSINRKGLDLFLSLPEELLFADLPLRKQLSAALSRGQVTLRLRAPAASHRLGEPAYKQRLLELKQLWQERARHLGFDPEKSIDLRFLAGQEVKPSAKELSVGEELAGQGREEILTFLQALCEKGLAALVASREEEGRGLAAAMLLYLSEIQLLLGELEAVVPLATKELAERLVARLTKLWEELSPSERESRQEQTAGWARECALLADRVDVSEELSRLRLHVQAMHQGLSSAQWISGKELEFRVQEMARELTTLGNKMSDMSVSGLTLRAKCALEKIREQVQNVE